MIILLNTLYLCLFGLIALTIGQRLLKIIRYQASYAETLGLAYLTGFTVLVYVGVLLALLGLFKLWIILLVAAGIVTLFSRQLWQDIKLLLTKCWQWLDYLWTHKLSAVLVAGLLVLISCNYLATFAPETERDAIGYHLPESQLIVETHQLTFPLADHLFYGNLPLLMEVAYALGIVVSGIALAHALHFSLFLAGLTFVFGWGRRHYSTVTGLLMILALFGLNQVANNATTALVDAGFMLAEVIAILLSVQWLRTQQLGDVRAAGLLFGVALSIKYSPLFSITVMTGILLIYYFWNGRPDKKSFVKLLGNWFGPMLVFGGFWYLKNLLLYHNPTYPLLFGHTGYGEAEYVSLVQAIKDFVYERNISNFLSLPYLLYWNWPLYALLAIPHNLTALLSIVVVPFVALVRKQRWQNIGLLAFSLALTLYWFFVATHQARFLDTAIIMVVLLCIITLTQLTKWLRFSLLGIGLGAIVVTGLYTGTLRYGANLLYASFTEHVLQLPKVKVALGYTTVSDYLDPFLDCGYNVLTYLNEQNSNGKVLDNWSQWHSGEFKFYDQYDRLTVLPPNLSTAETTQFMQTNEIQLIYLNTTSKQDFTVLTDPVEVDYYQSRIDQENALLASAELVYEHETCQLYRIQL